MLHVTTCDMRAQVCAMAERFKPARCSGYIWQLHISLQHCLYERSIAALNVAHVQLDGGGNVPQPLQQVGVRIIHLKALAVGQTSLHPAGAATQLFTPTPSYTFQLEKEQSSC